MLQPGFLANYDYITHMSLCGYRNRMTALKMNCICLRSNNIRYMQSTPVFLVDDMQRVCNVKLILGDLLCMR